MRITAIAAVAANSVIGSGATMLWHLPDDWRRFKRVTMGGQLIMGRRTFESMGDPLPGRRSIVITRQPKPAGEQSGPTDGTSVIFVSSLDEAIAAAREQPERRTWVIGGGEIYALAWPVLTDLDITEVHLQPEGEVVFPSIDPAEWHEISREPREGFDFVEYQRVVRADGAS